MPQSQSGTVDPGDDLATSHTNQQEVTVLSGNATSLTGRPDMNIQ